MKQTILSILICANIFGCSSVENTEIEEKNNVVEKNQNKDLFYNAFVGNVMEKEGKNNNAITYYENILEVQYDENYFNKLIELYLYKNDFISARNLIKKTDLENIQKNHPMFEMTFYLSKNENQKAMTLLNNQILKIKSNNKTPIFTLSQYYNEFAKAQLFFFQDDESESDFLTALKNENSSQYNLINNYLIESKNKVLTDYDFNDFKNDELTIAKTKIFIQNKDKSLFMDIIKDKNLNKIEKNEIVNLFYTHLNTSSEYLETLKYIKQADKEGLEKSQKTTYNQFFSYFATFDNNNALYTLDLIKDDVNKDFYFYYKAISNYRLGYKRAAKKYMVHVIDKKMILQSPLVYVDIMGTDDVFTHHAFSEQSDIHKNFLLFRYYAKKENKKEALFYLESMKEVINETGSAEDHELLIKEADYIFTAFTNIDESLKAARLQYEIEPSINSANSYLYALIISDSYNYKEANAIYNSFENEFDTNPSYLDTKAMFLLKKGSVYEALNIYKDNKLMFFGDVEVQKNISNVYKEIGNKKESLKHLKYSNDLFEK